MKLNKILLLLAAVFAFAACSDDDNDSSTQQGAISLPKLIKADWELNGNYTNASRYDFDKQGRISKIENFAPTSGANQSTITFTYNSDATPATQVVNETKDGVVNNYTIAYAYSGNTVTATYNKAGKAYIETLTIDSQKRLTAIETRVDGAIYSKKSIEYSSSANDIKMTITDADNTVMYQVDRYDSETQGIYKNVVMPRWAMAYVLNNYFPANNWIETSMFYPSQTGEEDYQGTYTFHQGYEADAEGYVYASTYYEFDWAYINEDGSYGTSYNETRYNYEYKTLTIK